MADFIQNLDPRSLVFVETVLSFAVSAFTAPKYNFPLFLFGIYSQENSDANESLKLFTYLLGGSVFLDIIWLARHGQNWFIRLLSIIILLFKLPTALAFLNAVRQRGDQTAGLGIRGGDLNGPTIWSMPGGFSSLAGGRNGYESVNPAPDIESNPRPPAPGPAPVSAVPPAPLPANQPSSGGYQTS